MTDNRRDRKRSESGEFVEETTLEDVLDVFTRVRGPVITTSDVADALNCTTEAARQKLRRLHDQDRVARRKTGRTTVYWRPSAPDDADTDATEDIAADGSPSRTATGGSAVPAAAPAAPQGDDERDNAVADADPLADIHFPHDPDRDREECVAAVYAARDFLREHGPASMKDIVREVMPKHPAAYDVDAALEALDAPDDRYKGSWWRKVVKPGLKALDDVKAPGTGMSEWTYTGGE